MKNNFRIGIAVWVMCIVMSMGGCRKNVDPGEEGELVFLDRQGTERYNKNTGCCNA